MTRPTPSARTSAARSSAHSSPLKRRVRRPRPCPRRSGAITLNRSARAGIASDQLRSAVANSPCTNSTGWGPSGPAAVRTKASPRPSRVTHRPSGRASAKCRSATSSRSNEGLDCDRVFPNISLLLRPLGGAVEGEGSGRPVRPKSQQGLDQVRDGNETSLEFETAYSGGDGGLLELAQAVDKSPDAVRAPVEVGGPAEAHPDRHGVMSADPAHVVHVQYLAGLRVLLEVRGAQVLDGGLDGPAQLGGRWADQAPHADERVVGKIAAGVQHFQGVLDALDCHVGRLRR